MAKVYSAAERAAWMKTLPSKRIGGLVLISNAQGQLLIQNPTYRDMWILPGGVVEDSESPVVGAARELQEELGLDIGPDRLQLKGVFYVPAHADFVDFLNTLFFLRLSDEEVSQIKLQDSEIEEYKFIDVEDIGDYMPEFLASGFSAIFRAEQPIFYDGLRGQRSNSTN